MTNTIELVLLEEKPDGSAVFDCIMNDETQQLVLEHAEKNGLTVGDYLAKLLTELAEKTLADKNKE